MPIILRLDRVMADRKMSLNELSEKVGVANVNLSKLKNGRVNAVRFSTLEAICEALDCQPGDILEYEKPQSSNSIRRDKKMSEELFPKVEYMIEPSEPVETAEEILREVKEYFAKENKAVEVIREALPSIVMIDNKKYVVRTDKFVGLMGGGRAIDEPHPVNYFGGQLGNVGGFKFIYLYSLKNAK